jgi:hypothetical protein
MNKPLAQKVTFDQDTMWVFLADGRTLGIDRALRPAVVK